MLRVKRASHLNQNGAIEMRGKKIEIKTISPAHWQLDGDPPTGKKDTSTLELVSNPSSLTIVTP
jgi:diacylglycerol kinase family enzyme